MNNSYFIKYFKQDVKEKFKKNFSIQQRLEILNGLKEHMFLFQGLDKEYIQKLKEINAIMLQPNEKISNFIFYLYRKII